MIVPQDVKHAHQQTNAHNASQDSSYKPVNVLPSVPKDTTRPTMDSQTPASNVTHPANHAMDQPPPVVQPVQSEPLSATTSVFQPVPKDNSPMTVEFAPNASAIVQNATLKPNVRFAVLASI